MIGLRTGVGQRPHRVLLQNPGNPIPNGDGGFTQIWSDLAPASVSAKIEPATAQELERVAPGTVVAGATHIVTLPYHPGVTVNTRIIFDGRTFTVSGVATPDERKVATIALCSEVVT